MKLILLGTAGYHPCESRHTACLLLPAEGLVLDAGTGFFRVRDRLATRTLDILLSHAHLDHVAGLTYLLSTAWQQSLERITVHGAADKLAAIREHLLDEQLFPAPLPCVWQPLTQQPLTLGSARVRHFPLRHPGGSVGYRLDWPGRSLAYVTDTTASADADYVAAVRGVSVLVHECNFPDEQAAWAEQTGHSHTTAVAEAARAAEVQRLILVHFDPLRAAEDPIGIETARRIFPATELGYDGLEIEF